MEVRERSLVMIRTKYGKPGVMLYDRKSTELIYDFHSTRITSQYVPYDLCITTKEIIENGDWYIRLFDDTIHKADENLDHIQYACNKIIATTDVYIKNLPRIPNDFVEAFINAYNNDHIITKVAVEYEHIGDHSYEIEEGKTDDYPIYELKVRSDNTIDIFLGGF